LVFLLFVCLLVCVVVDAVAHMVLFGKFWLLLIFSFIFVAAFEGVKQAFNHALNCHKGMVTRS